MNQMQLCRACARARAVAWIVALSCSTVLRAEAAGDETVAAFLDGLRVESPGEVRSLKTPLRALVHRLHDTQARKAPIDPGDGSTEKDSLAARRKGIREAREELVSGLESALGGVPGLEDAAARARELVDEAVEADRIRREDHIFENLMCWCPAPACNWTRILAGCPDPCAVEQKTLVRQWLTEGLTDQEIYDRMVEHPKGGPRVVTIPAGKNFWGFVLPLVLAGLAAVGVAALLVGVVRRGRKLSTSPTGAEAANGAPPDEESRWGEEIERELEEMEK